MFIDEARIASRIHHPNVVAIDDVIEEGSTLSLVMDFVHGASLAHVLECARTRSMPVPPRVVVAIMADVLRGLQAAHEARGESGAPLGIVHRDVSPQNILVGADGLSRVADFGIAKAIDRLQTTAEGQVKGKLSYMAPEQVRGEPATVRSDLHGVAVVLWEALAGRSLVQGDNQAAILDGILGRPAEPVSTLAEGVPAGLDAVVLRGLHKSPSKRFATARDMAIALEAALAPASTSEVAAFVRATAHEFLERQESELARFEAVHRQHASPVASAAHGSVRARARAVGIAFAVSVLVGLFVASIARPHGASSSDAAAALPAPTANADKAVAPALAAPSAPPAPSPPRSPTGGTEAPLPSPVASAPIVQPPSPRATSVVTKKRAPTSAQAHACSPPYWVDANGDKKYKIECLQ